MSERNSVRTCFGACAAGSSIALPIGKHAFACSSSPLQFHDRAGAFWGKVCPRLIGRKSFLLRKAINIDCQILTYVEELRWVARIVLARRRHMTASAMPNPAYCHMLVACSANTPGAPARRPSMEAH